MASRMLGAPSAFKREGQFLRGLQPQVLRPDAKHSLLLQLGPIGGPRATVLNELGQFNPSIVRAPSRLCSRCEFVATVRVDTLHQCNASSPLYLPKAKRGQHHFTGTALVVLDASYRVLGRTWLLNAPKDQISRTSDKRMADHWVVSDGSSDGFAPTWSKPIFDVRLFDFDGHIFATSVCPHYRCPFVVAHVQITAEQTADGGLRSLRAWQSEKMTARDAWARGRNQALFRAQEASGQPELMVQPWPGLIASFGHVELTTARFSCRAKPGSGDGPDVVKGDRRACGPTPTGARVTLPVLARVGNVPRAMRTEAGAFQDSLTLQHNETMNWGALGARGDGEVPSSAWAQTSKKQRFSQLSSTAHLVRIGKQGAASCEALLGVAHLHRTSMCSREFVEGDSRREFAWGSCYTHAFYLLEPRPPYGLMATSPEFCIASDSNPDDCESIQFVSSLALRERQPESALLLAYGANDCVPTLAELTLARVWQLMSPLRSGMLAECFGQ